MIGQAKTQINSIAPRLEGTRTHRRTKSTPDTVMRTDIATCYSHKLISRIRKVYCRADRASGRFTCFFSRI